MHVWVDALYFISVKLPGDYNQTCKYARVKWRKPLLRHVASVNCSSWISGWIANIFISDKTAYHTKLKVGYSDRLVCTK